MKEEITFLHRDKIGPIKKHSKSLKGRDMRKRQKFLRALFLIFFSCFLSTDLYAPWESESPDATDKIFLEQKMSQCPYLGGIFKREEKWLFSKEGDWLYANLAKGSKHFVFGYKKAEVKDWGQYLPRWSFTVGSMELGLVIASFKGIVKEEEYIVNSISTISKNCPFPDIQASLDYKEVIEQISIDDNCDHFFDKIYNVQIKSEADYHQEEPYAQAAKIVLDHLARLKSANW